MTEQNNAAPHECPQCGEPAYLGFGVPAKCVQKGCLFYDATLWSEWVMELPDVPDPVSDFEDEKTDPYGITFAGIPLTSAPSGSFGGLTLGLPTTYARHLNSWGSLIGLDRFAFESDAEYHERILEKLGSKP